MHSYSAIVLGFASLVAVAKGDCVEDCTVPTLVYQNLKCTPKYASPGDCCPKEYDCSHIYNRPAGTCHLRGKFYKPGQTPDSEDTEGNCDHARCSCTERQDFSCIAPSDTCAEFWVPGIPQPGCYLTYELNRCCRSGEKCPPFDGVAKCDVGGKNYDEGQRFDHPNKKCTRCICQKGFNGKAEPPFCAIKNCTMELKYSKEIDNHCAPLFRPLDSCCPVAWICPSEDGTYIPASTPPANTDLKCKFGEKAMYIGEKYSAKVPIHGNISCECAIPPYLTCKVLQ